MGNSQVVIKVFLIVALILMALVIVKPGKGARGQAIRRIMWMLGISAGILAVIFPQVTDLVASWLGIGRGTDLVLYMSIVFFLGYAVSNSVHARKVDREMTILARKYALLEAELAQKNS
ncbi:DUF2304 domain-containing protein [Arcanobacterium phocae]|uniref:DUF2304 domain-containing protein n=1 Tax=Arcanobacterium phocae TaxID=131112 RepID=UPI001C0E9813